ncbi:MAG: terpene cyclase/mutase family protein [Pirellulales bacterium]|nr:terpene cyclase/mutase family protein [Pirellulales bacterium]
MFLKSFFPYLVFSAMLAPAFAAEEAGREKSAAKWITPAADKAIEGGLKWLADAQHDDGSFGTGPARGNAAVCGLAGLAFMSGGSTPGRGPYGAQVNRCVDYLLASTQPSGFVNGSDSATHGPMYGHGFATMFLAECYGMSPRPELRDKLDKAVKLIVNCQNKDGGWRYFPIKQDADISVSVCQIMALRAARNAGIAVPKETVERSISYVKRSQNADGGFMYMLPSGESGFPRSAGGVVALYSAGVYEGKELEKGLDYLAGFLPGEGGERRESYYFYGHYYAVQAMWQAGGKRFDKWFPAIRDDLISKQRGDGAWNSSESIDEYSTAMACIILQIPNDYLPIFQR